MARTLLSLVAFLALGSVASAATVIAGDHVLLPNTPNQVIQILVSGGDNLFSTEFVLQIGDGSSPGPLITGVDMTSPGTIFTGNNLGPAVTIIPLPDHWSATQVWASSGYVSMSGILAYVTIDTTGVAPGVYDLLIGSPVNEMPSLFASPSGDIFPTLVHGTLSIVPEPSSFALAAFGLIATLTLVRRRCCC